MKAVSVYGVAAQSIHGPNASDFWNALCEARIPKSYTFSSETRGTNSQLEFLTQTSVRLWNQLKGELQSSSKEFHYHRLGVIFASTKGCIDDYIWNETAYENHASIDSLSPVLEKFLDQSSLTPGLSLCISNACASSLSALALGQRWINQNRVDAVLVLSADLSGEFVQKGFACLHATTPTSPKPFAANRDGLALGEVVSAILIGKEDVNYPVQLESVGIDVEGYAVTRPSPSGQSLKRAFAASSKRTPDLIIAHGTATPINDIAEDQSFFDLFGRSIPITATKWCIGHTLGASGSLDFIAAFFALQTGKTFRIASTAEKDPDFHGNYLTSQAPLPSSPQSVLISSLGFGGVHAVGILRKAEA